MYYVCLYLNISSLLDFHSSVAHCNMSAAYVIHHIPSRVPISKIHEAYEKIIRHNILAAITNNKRKLMILNRSAQYRHRIQVQQDGGVWLTHMRCFVEITHEATWSVETAFTCWLERQIEPSVCCTPADWRRLSIQPVYVNILMWLAYQSVSCWIV